jgi:iron complex transport system substrate-binding protein
MHLPRRTPVPLAAAALLLPLTAACSTGAADADDTGTTARTSAEPDAFPVTIEHAFGETTIEEEPTRVAGVGWADADFALALGVVPVGATAITWGGNDQQSTDFFDAALAEVGGDEPVRWSDADGVPVAEIAKTDPDLILATNSGITEQEYEKLSKIAPTIAYPEDPWVTSWQDSLEMTGEALGRSDQAERVEDETEQVIEDTAAKYPQIVGKTFIFASIVTSDLSSVGIYSPEDNRPRMLEELGMVNAPVVEKVSKPGQFYTTVSAERAADLDSDVLLTYAMKKDDLRTFEDDPLIGQIPAIRSGHAYAVLSTQESYGMSGPSPLSIPDAMENYIPHVAAAVDGRA